MNKSIFYIALFSTFAIQFFAQLNVTTAGSLNYPRWGHESQTLLDGKVISFGGDNGDLSNNIVYNNSEIYNPSSNSWSIGPNMNSFRTNFASAILNDGRVLAIGGRDENFNNLNTCEIYNPATNSWSNIASLNEARSFHKAIRLYMGKVLVVGGNSGTNTAEIYDPYSNTWIYTDTLAKRHLSGFSFVSPGYVSGGSGAPSNIETFNETTNSWELKAGGFITPRNNHSSIFIPVWGSLLAFTGESIHKKTEAYQFSNGISYNKGNLLTEVNNNTPVAFDNGDVLVYGIGDFLAPSNTKCLQLFSTTTNSWTTGTYNFVGADVYGINKLYNGKVLINGGTFTTGNGATNECKLVGLSSYSACVPPNLNLALTAINSCYGKSHTITIQGSESGVTYEARIAQNVVSLTTVNGNGTNRDITLSPTYFQPGDNIVSIVAKKPGCPAYYLNNNVVITPSLAITETPTISPSGTVLACMGDNITLTTTSGYSNYIWSYPQVTNTSNTLSVNPNKTVYVKFKDANGCTSVASQMVKITAPTSLQVGPKISVCQNQGVIQFTANPIGGTWAGSGVTSAGLFDPASVTSGTYNLTYSKCGLNATKTVSVYPVTVPSYSAVYTSTAICANQTATLQIQNSSFGVKYQLRNGNTLINTAKNGTGGALTFTTNVITSSAVFNILATTTGTNCNTDTLITQHYIKVKNSTLTKITVLDTLVCIGKKALIVIDSAQAGVTYSLQTQSGSYLQHKAWDGDSIAFSVGPINTYTVFNIYMSHLGCNNIYLDQSIRPVIKIQTPEAFFAPSKFNIQSNEYITFSNNSPIPNSVYSWSFGSGASINSSTLTIPDSVNYSTLGTKYIKLKLTTPIGCIDSLIQRINVIAPVSQENCAEMGILSDNISSILTAITPDKFGNTYAFIRTTFSQKNQVYSNKFDTLDLVNKFLPGYPQTIALVKFNNAGIPQWVTKVKHSANVSSGNITTDSIGNIYFTFLRDATTSGGGGKLPFYSTDNSYLYYNIPNPYPDKPVIFCKYSSNGKFIWAKSYADYGTDNAQIHIDKLNNIYTGSERNYNKYDVNGNQIWANRTVGPMFIEGIDTESLNNFFVLKRSNISIEKRDNQNSNLISTTIAQTNVPNNYSNTYSSHLKVQNNSGYIAGVFKGKIIFAGDTFFVNKDQFSFHVDGFLASSNLVSNNQNWLIQIRIKNTNLLIEGLDFKNNRGTVLGYLYYPNDSVFVKNEKLAMPNGGHFMFNFDSLGNVSNLISVNSNLVSNLAEILYNTKYDLNENNNDVLIGYKIATTYTFNVNGSFIANGNTNKFIIKKGDMSCLLPITTNLENKIDLIDNTNNNVVVFPNPKEYNHTLNILVFSDKMDNSQIAIFDLTGKIVCNQSNFKLSSGENNIEFDRQLTNELKPGIYFLNVKTSTINKTTKLIVN